MDNSPPRNSFEIYIRISAFIVQQNKHNCSKRYEEMQYALWPFFSFFVLAGKQNAMAQGSGFLV